TGLTGYVSARAPPPTIRNNKRPVLQCSGFVVTADSRFATSVKSVRITHLPLAPDRQDENDVHLWNIPVQRDVAPRTASYHESPERTSKRPADPGILLQNADRPHDLTSTRCGIH